MAAPNDLGDVGGRPLKVGAQLVLGAARSLRLVTHSQVEVLEARVNKNGDFLVHKECVRSLQHAENIYLQADFLHKKANEYSIVFSIASNQIS